jgi:hypothetical protein
MTKFSARLLRSGFAAGAILLSTACIDAADFVLPPLDPAMFPPFEIPVPTYSAPPAPALPPPVVQDFGTIAIYEAHRPNTTGNEGTEKCTAQKPNCNKANIANRALQAEENQQNLVNAAASAAQSGQKATVTVPAATDNRCGANSAGGNIACDSNLAQQRATASAKEIKDDLAKQGVASVIRKDAANCPADMNIVCIVTVANPVTGNTTASGSLAVQQPVTPAIAPAGTPAPVSDPVPVFTPAPVSGPVPVPTSESTPTRGLPPMPAPPSPTRVPDIFPLPPLPVPVSVPVPAPVSVPVPVPVRPS